MSDNQENMVVVATFIGVFLLLPVTTLFSGIAVLESNFKSNVLPPFLSAFLLVHSALIGYGITVYFSVGQRMPNYEYLTMAMVAFSLIGFSQLKEFSK
jgi:hypothetical protein